MFFLTVCSASNYMLGLTPLPFLPFALGSLPPLVFWAFFYASLGGASRSLWSRGVAPDVLLADLLDKAAVLSGDAGRAALTLALLGGVVLLVGSVCRRKVGRPRQPKKQSLGPDEAAKITEPGLQSEILEDVPPPARR